MDMLKKKFRIILKISFITLLVLLVALLGLILVRDNTTVINTRDDEKVLPVENVVRAEAEDGAFAEFSFTLDEELEHDTNLAFYVSHQWIDVFIGDEQVYSLKPSGELSFIKTAGAKWVRLHIHREDEGKTVRVVLTPCYEGNLEDSVDFYMGSTLALYRTQFRNALPATVLCLLNILVGIILLIVAIYSKAIHRESSNLLSLSMLGIVMGLWQVSHNDFSPFIWEDKTILLYYISVTMMLVCMIPLVRSAGVQMKEGGKPVLRIYLLAVAVMASVQIILQMLGILDLREMFPLTHGSIILGAVLMIASAVYDKLKGKTAPGGSKYAWILAVGALGDLVLYYLRSSSSGLLMILSAILCFMLLEGSVFLTSYRKQGQLLAEKETQLTNSRVMTSMSQIRSHFVFNILNAISGMCKYDPEKADETIVRFSRYLRNNIDIMEDDKMLPFETELQHLEDYVVLEQVRFGDRLNFVTDLEVTGFRLPPLVLQPLVENAIKHGITTKEGGGTILLSTWEEEGNIMIAVDDDGVGFDTTRPTSEKSIGLKNIRFRLQHLVKGTLTIKSEVGKGTKAVITIPRKTNY